MTDALCITVPGQPVAKGRARVTRKGWAYTPKKTRAYEALFKALAKAAMKGREMFMGAVSVTVIACMKMPASWSKKKRALAVGGGLAPLTKPDLDNIVKNLDALNGVVWKDDSQIVSLEASKRYSLEPKLEVSIRGMR